MLQLGFRIFFAGAGLFAIVTMALWSGVYVFGVNLPMSGITIFQWHAHEMIYGYAMAVIAGFLLTAVQNWTGIQTPQGGKLLGLFLLWAASRVLFLFGTRFLFAAAILDMLFMLGLIVATALPIVKVRQWRQGAILGKLALLAAANTVFYLGAAGMMDRGVFWGVYSGFYLVIALILTMGRRVVPGFIERGVGYPVKLRNSTALDISILVFYLGFFFIQVFAGLHRNGAGLAAVLFVLLTIRLAGWHTPGIWKKPLLWSLYVSMIFIDLGFLLAALVPVLKISPFIAIHAFAVGGVGLVTMSMMSRVSLGHTGRSVQAPPRAVTAACAVLILAALVRVAGPLFDAADYRTWILTSQLIWIAAFGIFVAVLAPMLLSPRVDGQPG